MSEQDTGLSTDNLRGDDAAENLDTIQYGDPIASLVFQSGYGEDDISMRSIHPRLSHL